MSSDFDVFYRKHALFYIKDNCTNDDTRSRFFLHIVPRDKGTLSDDRRRQGFDNFNFYFDEHGVFSDGQCGAVRKIPDYDIATIQTGQFIPGEGGTWEANISFSKD